jgi:nitrate reductase NapD
VTDQTTDSFHITSFIVRCFPQRLQEVMDKVAALAGVEIHGSDPSGKFVALLDLESEKTLVDTITSIELVEGVINTSMVYHHAE